MPTRLVVRRGVNRAFLYISTLTVVTAIGQAFILDPYMLNYCLIG